MKPEEITPELLEWLKNTAEKTGTFVEREAPILAQEAVAYELTMGIMGIATGVILIAIGLLIFSTCYRKWSVMDIESDWEAYATIGTIALVAFGVVGTVAIGVNTPKALKAATAPRLVVLEKVSELLK